MRHRVLVAFAVLWVAVAARSAWATQIDPMTFPELVIQADFVGVVECMTAGGIVARYRVVESWKGAEAGKEVAIRIPPNYWEPQFAIALVGERFIVAAFASDTPSRMVSTTLGGPVPLWWRRVPADYSTPLFQGVHPLDSGAPRDAEIFFSGKKDLDSFGTAVKDLLKMPAEEQDLVVANVLVDKYMVQRKPEGGLELPEEVKALQKKAAEAKSADEVLAAIPGNLPQDYQWRARRVKETLVALRSRRAAATQPLAPVKAVSPDAPPRSTAEQMEQHRKALTGPQNDGAFGKAFMALMALTQYEPATVVDFLVSWDNPRKHWSDAERGYELGSVFAHHCPPTGRVAMLTKLCDAKDPMVRVAGAVYLAFDDPKAATAKLKKFAKLPGDAGVWAALTLARRGDAGALPRTLEVFESAGKSNMEGVPHRNLQKRVLVLLSNSAAANQVPQPPRTQAGFDRSGKPTMGKTYEALKAWLKENEGKLRPADPWLAELIKQRVD